MEIFFLVHVGSLDDEIRGKIIVPVDGGIDNNDDTDMDGRW